MRIKITLYIQTRVGYFKKLGPVFSYKLPYIVGFGLDQSEATIYRILYENLGPEPIF